MKSSFLTLLAGFCLLLLTVSHLPAAEPPPVQKPSKEQMQQAPTVVSLVPAQGEPGTKVTMHGIGFTEKLQLLLGTMEIAHRVIDGKIIEFIVPKMEPGVYALSLKRSEGGAPRTYTFAILPLRPVLSSLSPDRISSCSTDGERDVTARGGNFSLESVLLFNGTVIRSTLNSPESISFQVPPVNGGLHQVMVKNGPDVSSLPLGLVVESRPEITSVSIGRDFVNYYEISVSGRNFQQGSTLLVEGKKLGRGTDSGEMDKIVNIECSQITFIRFPFSPALKEVRIQVVNSNGESSQVVTVNAP